MSLDMLVLYIELKMELTLNACKEVVWLLAATIMTSMAAVRTHNCKSITVKYAYTCND